MADNIAVTPGVGATVAADDVGGTLFQRVKLAMGADGAFDADVDSGQQTSANSVPVVRASDEAPPTGGGLSLTHLVAAASNNATSVKASAGQVYHIYALNENASRRYLKFFDKGSAPTPGSDTVIATYTLVQNVPLQLNLSWGLKFALGIAFAITANKGDSDNTAISANDVVMTLGYK